MIARKRRAAEEKGKNVEEKLANLLRDKKEASIAEGQVTLKEEDSETIRFDEKSLGLSQIVEKAKSSGDPFNNPNK
jgi:predicted phage-related endonuclease